MRAKIKNNMKNKTNKTIAILGIGTYILSVLSSATDLEGNSVAPVILIVISGIATIIFIVMATVRLWKEAKNLSIMLVSSALILFIFTVIQELTSPSYGNLIIILFNIVRVIYFVAFVWVVIKLFKMKEIGTVKNTDALGIGADDFKK